MRTLLFAAVLALLLICVGHPDAHAAATAGGGQFPWDTGLTNLKNDLTGPAAAAIGLLAAFCALIALVWAAEMGGVVRALVIIVFIVGSLTGITALMTSFGIAGAVV